MGNLRGKRRRLRGIILNAEMGDRQPIRRVVLDFAPANTRN